MKRHVSFGVGITLQFIGLGAFSYFYSMDPGDNTPGALLIGAVFFCPGSMLLGRAIWPPDAS